MKSRVREFVLRWINRLLRSLRTGAEPLDPEKLMWRKDKVPFNVVPSFRYYYAWPWTHKERPLWLPAYPTPDHTPSRSNMAAHPEWRALNRRRPLEASSSWPADVIEVVEVCRGAPVVDVRWNGKQRNSSDVWCKVVLLPSYLRSDTELEGYVGRIIFGYDEPTYYGWVPAIWLAYA